MILDPEEDFESVRKALHQQIDAALLPDSTIALDIYQGRAEREIKARIPDAEARTGDEAVLVKNAATFWLASLLAPVVELVLSEALPGGGYRYQRPETNWRERADLLMGAALTEIERAAGSNEASAARPIFFSAARRHR